MSDAPAELPFVDQHVLYAELRELRSLLARIVELLEKR